MNQEDQEDDLEIPQVDFTPLEPQLGTIGFKPNPYRTYPVGSTTNRRQAFEAMTQAVHGQDVMILWVASKSAWVAWEIV